MSQKRESDHHEPGVSTLGDLLRAKREAERLSLPEMAAKLHISRPYLSKLECGKQAHPSPAILSRIAEPLAVSVEDLYALVGYLPPENLPGLAPYLRAKHPDWPKSVIAELVNFYEFQKHMHSLR